MGVWTVRGGNRLYGTVLVQGSRNGALPLLAASLIHPGITVLERVPRVEDVSRFLEILQCLGCSVLREGDRVTIDASDAKPGEIDRSLTDGLRASVLFLGAMAARFGEGCVPMPESCGMGPRPLDMHFAALSRLGARLVLDEASIACAPSRLEGREVVLPYPSVGATMQALLAASGAQGETLLRGCAREPEVADLALYLTKCGHHITGMGTDTMTIQPGTHSGKLCHRVLPDRIAAGTLLCAVAACGGKLILEDIFSSHLLPLLDGLAEMGCNIKIRDSSVTLLSDGVLTAPNGETVTAPYPGFPTDSLPAFLAAVLRAEGVTMAREQVMPGRGEALKLLRRFGGVVSFTDDCGIVVAGAEELLGAHVEVRDVQTAAGALLAALQAEGTSYLVDHGMLARAYAYLDATLRQLGAEVSYTD